MVPELCRAMMFFVKYMLSNLVQEKMPLAALAEETIGYQMEVGSHLRKLLNNPSKRQTRLSEAWLWNSEEWLQLF